MNDIIAKIIALARNEKKPRANVMLKLVEEVGELAEAINHQDGYLPHKVMKETIEGEVADVVQCAITSLVKSYPDLTDHEIFVMLMNKLDQKNEKWEALI